MSERGHDLAEAGLGVLRTLGWARAWAFFAIGTGGARLLASDKIDRRSLDVVSALADTHATPTLARLARGAAGDDAPARLIVALRGFISPREHGLLYLEDPPVQLQLPLLLDLQPHDLHAVLRTRVGIRSPLSPRPSEASVAGAEPLRDLLARHEWNVARVARLLGVTRMTVYNRMRRRGVLRVKNAKAPRRGRPGREGA